MWLKALESFDCSASCFSLECLFESHILLKMIAFYSALQKKLHTLSEFNHLEIQLESPIFMRKKGTVAQFIQEITQTGAKLTQQTDSQYAEVYAQKLVQQFDLLQKAVKRQRKQHHRPASFQNNYRFPRNIHNLPVEKRLQEYRKALRLLNEKLTWLMEQAQGTSLAQRQVYVAQIHETEYRKMKCLQAIDELER